MNNKHLLFILTIFFSINSLAQQDSTDTKTVFKLTVKDDLLELEPQRAFGSSSSILSGVDEDIFTSSGNVYVITRDEIEKNGVQNIAEALRLAPGCMVREKTKGNYDVSMSGASFLRGSEHNYSNIESKDILILTNGIPILNFTNNNTWWQNLPNIAFIDQIEVLNGVSIARYGASSVGGVINIITQKMPLNKLRVIADAGMDLNADHYLTLLTESALSEKLRGNVNFVYTFTKRPNSDYYATNEQGYIDAPSLLYYQSEANKTNSHTDLSSRNIHFSSMVEYTPNNALKLNLLLENTNTSLQEPLYQRDHLFLNERSNNSSSATFVLQYNKLQFTTKNSVGKRNEQIGVEGMNYSFWSSQNSIFLPFSLSKLKIRPGLFYNHIGIKPIFSTENSSVLTPHRKTNYNTAGAYSSFEYIPFAKLKTSANISYEYFPELKKGALASTLSVGYSPSKRLYLYFAAGKSYASPTIQTFSTLNTDMISFNTELDFLEMRNVSVGIRAKVKTIMEAEGNLFLRNYSSFHDETIDEGQTSYINNATKLAQLGATINLKLRLERVLVKAFATYVNNDYSGGEDVQQTNPNFYGGISANYSVLFNRLNFNLAAYAKSDVDLNFNGIPVNTDFNIIPYFKTSFKLSKESKIYFVAKNFLSSPRVEYAFSDYIPSQFLVGLRFNLIAKQ